MKLKYNAPKIEIVEVVAETHIASGSEDGQVGSGYAKRGFFDEDEDEDEAAKPNYNIWEDK